MSILRRLFSRTPPAGQETRAATYYRGGLSIGSGGPVVNARLAENLSTVTACVNVIGSGLASLPARVYRTEGDGRVEVPGHPVARLIRTPNARQTWPDWVEWTVGQVLLQGNALSVIEYDRAGRPTGLFPVPWQGVRPVLLPSGRMAYDVVSYQQPWGGSGQPRRFLDDEVLHLRDRSDDGFVGRSRLSRAPDVLAAAVGLQTYSASVWENAATPSGMVGLPANISPDGKRRIEAFFTERYTGAANGRKVLFADAESKFTALNVSPEDAEALASRRFTVEELCRVFQVPPPLIQSYEFNTFTNAAQASTWFATLTLAPWARKIEAEFQRSLFADPTGATHVEIDLSGLTRGDPATRWANYGIAVDKGILDANEIREAEGYNPRPAKAAPAAEPVT